MAEHPLQQSGHPQNQAQSKKFPWKRIAFILLIFFFLLAFACFMLWNLINAQVLHGTFFDILSKILVAVGSAAGGLGGSLIIYIGIASSLKTILPHSTETTESSHNFVHTAPSIPELSPFIPPSPPYITSSLTSPIASDKPTTGTIIGSFPPTNPKSIQQRQKLVEHLHSELIKSDINCLILTGIGGIGKSTLAALVYRYAEEQRKQNPDPFSAEAFWLTIEEATASFAYLAEMISTALDKPIPGFGKLPPQQQATALFNALDTTNHPRLIVVNQFENLLDSQTGEAIDPALNAWLDMLNSRPCRCRLLLTSSLRPIESRKYLATYIQIHSVEGLKVTEGVELLRSQGVKGTDSEVETAVKRCQGHAYALVLLIALVHEDRISLATLLKDPALWTGGAGEVAINLLDTIYKQLSNIQQELLRAFSVYRMPVPLEAAQAVVTMPLEPQIRPAFRGLLKQYLIQAPEEDRYQLHLIVADYVRDHFDDHDRQANKQALRAAHARAAEYYLQQADKSCPVCDKRQKVDDVQLLIEAIWQYCQAGQWQEAYNLMEQEKIFNDLKRWGDNTILLELYELLLPLERWSRESPQAARIYKNLGRIYRTLGRKEQARESFKKALSLCQEVGDRGGEGEALSFLGRVYADLGYKQRAREYLERALKIRKEVGDREGEGWTLDNLGRVYDDLGLKNRAQECCEQALAIRRELGDQRGEGTTLITLGRVYDDLGQKSQALEYYGQALKMLTNVGDRGGRGVAFNNLGRVLAELGQQEQAQQYLEQALRIRKEVGDRLAEGHTLKNLGLVYSALGKQEKALEALEQALNISREVSDRWCEGMTFYNLGRVYTDLGQKTQARKHFEQALKLSREVGDRRGEGRALSDLAWVYSHIEEKELIWEYYGKALTILKEVEDRWGEGRILHNIGMLFFERSRYDIALAFFLLARAIFETVQSPSRDGAQRWIDALRKKVGEQQFAILLVRVESHAQQIVEQTLHEGL